MFGARTTNQGHRRRRLTPNCRAVRLWWWFAVCLGCCLLADWTPTTFAAEMDGSDEEAAGSDEALATAMSTHHIAETCVQKCPDQNPSGTSEHIDCGLNCYMEQCQLGCSLWKTALLSSCNAVCNNTNQKESKELYCAMSCQNALNDYFNWLIAKVGTPSAPALVADTLTDTSLSLEWEIPELLTAFSRGQSIVPKSYLVQWRYEEMEGDWKFCRNQSLGENSTVKVEHLQPYTKYRFRVALILSAQHDKQLFSEQSVIISTKAMGKPQSAPVIVSATAVDHARIYVSWRPGPFTNGEILSYTLRITEITPPSATDDDTGHHHHNTTNMTTSTGYSAVKDLNKTDQSYLYEKLKPNTTYQVEISMTNERGQGPPAFADLRTNPAPPTTYATPEISLILGGENTVDLATINDYQRLSTLQVFTSDSVIVGLAVHIAHQMLFVSDVDRFIYRTKTHEPESAKVIVRPPNPNGNDSPLDLSVDWLNDYLYFTVHYQNMWQISRCDLSGSGETVVLAGLLQRPVHFEVDPYNGYLFWSMRGKSSNGIYRLDLADISNGVKHEIKPVLVFESRSLGPFTMDYAHFKLLVPVLNESRIVSMDLDGKCREDVRNNNNTQGIHLQQITAISTINQLFYWAESDRLVLEEFHKVEKRYFNTIRDGNNPWRLVRSAVAASQPIPIPVNPPSNLQALLDVQGGKISWQVPHLLPIQGRGSWQTWNYELEFIEEESNIKTVEHVRNRGNYYAINHLHSNTDYRFRVSAFTAAGRGPWSTAFRTKTLQSRNERYLIWASKEGLQRTDVLGEHIQEMVAGDDLQNITNLAWLNDVVYFVNNFTLRFYNQTSKATGVLENFHNVHVQSVAVDWLASRLYWLTRDGQVMFRGKLDGREQEALFSLSARDVEIQLDPTGGFMYFSTGHTVENCRLNGRNRNELYMFSYGKQVMGLTIDLDHQLVYWIVRGYDESSLFSAPMAGQDYVGNAQAPAEYQLLTTSIMGPLSYFSDRLIWLQDPSTTIIANTTGRNLAHVRNAKLNELRTIAVIDPDHHRIPETAGGKPLNVIPEPVNSRSVKILGNWKSFNISWAPVLNVNHGEVFYDIRFLDIMHTDTQLTNFHYVNDLLPPFSAVNISIQAYTYWGKSAVTRVNMTSPASKPFTPLNPRVFVKYHHNPFKGGLIINATFRWSKSAQHNGPNLGYSVSCWKEDAPLRVPVLEIHVSPDVHEHIVSHLDPNSTYGFQVMAFASVGSSKPTEVVTITTDHENPVPELLAIVADTIIRVDLDLRTTSKVVNTGSTIRHLTRIANEDTLFWINDHNELMSFANNTKSKLATIQSHEVLALTVDWVNRLLFWSQTNDKLDGSSIYCFDLNKYEGDKWNTASLLTVRSGYVWNLLVSPLDRNLVWVEMNTNSTTGSIYRFSLVNKTTQAFFKRNEAVRRTLTLDTSSAEEPYLIWSNENGILFSSSMAKKTRHQLGMAFNAANGQIAKDSGRMYWIRHETIVAMNASESSPAYEMRVPKVSELLAFYQQPYPSAMCLFPVKQTGYTISLESSKERSLILRLPAPTRNSTCSYDLAGARYTIVYGKIGLSENRARPSRCTEHTCKGVVSFDEVKEIGDLEPFQEYKFQVSITNYYADKMGESSADYGPVVVFHTAIGAPSPPRNVTVTVISLNEVKIEWLPPLHINADRVSYEVLWQTQFDVNGLKNQQSVLMNKNFTRNFQSPLSKIITAILPDQTYRFVVRAITSNSTSSESEPKQIHTLPEPKNITLISRQPNSLHLHWTPYPNISKYLIHCEDLSTTDSHVVFNSTVRNVTVGHFIADELQPKSKYRFTIQLFFGSHNKSFNWPTDNRSTFETVGDRPSAPGKPVIEFVTEAVFKVSWEPSKNNGAPIIMYSLEVWRQQSSSNRVKRMAQNDAIIDPLNAAQLNYTKTISNPEHSAEEQEFPDEVWDECYNGTENFWIIDKINAMESSFRVKALNDFGWSSFSIESGIIGHSSVSADRKEYLLMAVFIPISSLALFLVLASCMIITYNRRATAKQILESEMTRAIPIDVELANLRQFQRSENFIHNDNLLYAQGQPTGNGELSMLAQIRRENIRLLEPLGSGQFGDVYKGVIKTAGGPGEGAVSETRVAIKTLKKGASEQDKNEFLQEAQLMSNCKHEHILHLIGVCFHADELFIVMELMEAGDLKMFLRQSRATESKPPSLSLLDLLSICVDVASGCRYLEEMHFIHRDLACRNCLVSSADPMHRVVKIGDFGLARDIYSNDYYRKDGLGLMPVRWTSPECVEDGVFTAQSDIWAFGVLCWEIMTMGQQPYPARSNLEVLSYVKSGGRLSCPVDCPDELYQLMLRCWSDRKEDRPSFRYCLDVVRTLTETTSKAVQLSSGSMNRLHNCGIFNPLYLLADENHNHSNKGGSLKISIDGHDRAEPPIIVTPTSSTASPISPKYLELVHDELDDHLLTHPQTTSIHVANGYEIPLPDYYRDADAHSAFSYDSTSITSSHHHTNSRLADDANPSRHLEYTTAVPCPASMMGEPDRTSFGSGSSSTASDTSNFGLNEQSLSANTVLSVALPNSKENCSSNETLLAHHRGAPEIQTTAPAGMQPDKALGRLHSFYAHSQHRDGNTALSNGEAKTMM